MIQSKILIEKIHHNLRMSKGYEVKGYEVYYFLPQGEMEEFWQYSVTYACSFDGELRFDKEMIYYYKNLKDKNNLETIDIPSPYYEDYIIFEFPEEEIALYFELKFCS